MPKLIAVSALIEALCFVAALFLSSSSSSDSDSNYWWLLLLGGIIYYFVMYNRYRNSGARHAHESETKKNVTNLRKVDNLIKRKNRLKNSSMDGANNHSIKGGNAKKGMLDNLKDLAK